MTGLRERNKSKRRTAILDATLVRLRTEPFDEITVEQIAADAEVSPHTVYNLVGTRHEIIFQLLGRVVRHMAETSPVFDDHLDRPEEPLMAVMDHAVDALLEEPAAYRQVVRIGASLRDWPEASADPPALIADAATCLERHGALVPGISPTFVASQQYHGFAGWAMSWANERVSDAAFQRGVRQHLAIVLAATTTGALQAHAQDSMRKKSR